MRSTLSSWQFNHGVFEEADQEIRGAAMNEGLAIAAVSAVLKSILENAVIAESIAAGAGDVVVSVLSPDRISTGAEERGQLNLYLYRVTPNSGWRRSTDNEAIGKAGGEPPLVLDLHYLLTAYAERDFQAEILLGCAMQALHSLPILTGDRIAAALTSALADGGAHTALAALSSMDASSRIEQLKIRAEFLSLEDLSKLWSALQAHSRLSATYEVSAVVIGNTSTRANGQSAASTGTAGRRR